MTAFPPTAPDDSQLQTLEATAVRIAAAAGDLLDQRFLSVLEVRFKDAHGSDPVTEVDHAVEDLVRAEIVRQFPDHGVLGEEGEPVGPAAADFTWIIDPLDGTSNFINGLPLFATSIGVLWRGEPVVGAIFVPAGRHLRPGVFHARRGGGAFFDDAPVRFQPVALAPEARLSGMPGGIRAGRGSAGRRFGIPRTLGSIAVEMALTAEGALQVSLFGGAKIWDVAGGTLICREAGAVVYTRPRRGGRWQVLDRFRGAHNSPPTLTELRAWNDLLVTGDPDLLPGLAEDLLRRYRRRRLLRRFLPRRG